METGNGRSAAARAPTDDSSRPQPGPRSALMGWDFSFDRSPRASAAVKHAEIQTKGLEPIKVLLGPSSTLSILPTKPVTPLAVEAEISPLRADVLLTGTGIRTPTSGAGDPTAPQESGCRQFDPTTLLPRGSPRPLLERHPARSDRSEPAETAALAPSPESLSGELVDADLQVLIDAARQKTMRKLASIDAEFDGRAYQLVMAYAKGVSWQSLAEFYAKRYGVTMSKTTMRDRCIDRMKMLPGDQKRRLDDALSSNGRALLEETPQRARWKRKKQRKRAQKTAS